MRVALDNNAGIMVRPKSISQDYSKSEDALLHFAKQMNFDILVFISICIVQSF